MLRNKGLNVNYQDEVKYFIICQNPMIIKYIYQTKDLKGNFDIQ